MADQWQPPAENEFNHEWLRPTNAVELVGTSHDSESTTRRWLMARLKTGVIQAVARTSEVHGKRIDFSPVPQRLWKQLDEWGEEHFWQTGDQVFHYGGESIQMLDIRFDVETLGSRARKPDPPEAAAGTERRAVSRRNDTRTNISAPDAERFCRFLLEVRPNATERDAHRRAVDFFHDRKVPRDWFWDIFRAIRGHRNRGKQPKTRI
jgi:hypothetical protein